MADTVDEEAKALQRDVQRLLGRCMLRLQQYERLLKAMIADHKISGVPQDLAAAREMRVDSLARQTLGPLLKELVGSFLGSEASDKSPDMTTGSVGGPPTVSIRVGITLDMVFPFGDLRLLPILSCWIACWNRLNSFFQTTDCVSQ